MGNLVERRQLMQPSHFTATSDLRYGGMNQFDMSDKGGRNGVAERTDDLLAVSVRVDLEVGVKELVGLADWERDAQPIPGRGDGIRGQPGLLEPGADSVDGLRGRGNELLNL